MKSSMISVTTILIQLSITNKLSGDWQQSSEYKEINMISDDITFYFELAYQFANHYTQDAKELLDVSDEEFDRLFDQLEQFMSEKETTI